VHGAEGKTLAYRQGSLLLETVSFKLETLICLLYSSD
jgi:hypothetical protein